MLRNLFVTSFVLLVFAIGYLVYCTNFAPDNTISKSLSNLKSSLLSNPEVYKYSFKLGEEKIYKIEQTAKINFSTNNSLGKTTKISLKGELSSTTLKIEKDYIINLVTLPGAQVDISTNNVSVNPALIAKYRQELSGEFFLKINHLGNIDKMYVHNNASLESAKLIQGIYTSMQLVLPNELSNVVEWNTEEIDTLGKYSAKYRLKNPGNTVVNIEKNKQEYSLMLNSVGELLPVQSAMQKAQIDSSSKTIFDFDSLQGILTSVSEKEIIYIQAPETKIQTEIETLANFIKSSIKTISIAGFDENNLLQKGELKTLVALKTENKLQQKRIMLEKKLVGVTLPALFQEINSSLDVDTKKTNLNLFDKLVTYFSIYPEQITELASQIRKLNPDSKNMDAKLALYFGVYTSLKSQEAEKNLLELAEEFKSDSAKARQAIPALTNFPVPTAATKEFLLKLNRSPPTKEVGMLSAFALGAVAKKMGDTNKQEPDVVIVDYLMQNFRNAEGSNKLDLLGALGNSGSNKVLPLLKEVLISGTADEKLAAIYSLRHQPFGEADELLKSSLIDSKSSDDLKIQALKTLQYRTNIGENIEIAQQVYAGSQNDRVKSQAISTIGTIGSKSRERAKTILQNIILNEKSDNVSLLAKKMAATL